MFVRVSVCWLWLLSCWCWCWCCLLLLHSALSLGNLQASRNHKSAQFCSLSPPSQSESQSESQSQPPCLSSLRPICSVRISLYHGSRTGIIVISAVSFVLDSCAATTRNKTYLGILSVLAEADSSPSNFASMTPSARTSSWSTV